MFKNYKPWSIEYWEGERKRSSVNNIVQKEMAFVSKSLVTCLTVLIYSVPAPHSPFVIKAVVSGVVVDLHYFALVPSVQCGVLKPEAQRGGTMVVQRESGKESLGQHWLKEGYRVQKQQHALVQQSTVSVISLLGLSDGWYRSKLTSLRLEALVTVHIELALHS